jgi:hypothetical protein
LLFAGDGICLDSLRVALGVDEILGNNSRGRTIWIADAHRGDGKRFVVRADEKLSAFMELESAIRGKFDQGLFAIASAASL